MHYPWHPLEGRELKVLRTCGGQRSRCYEVEVDGYRLAIPAWMAEPDCGARVQLAPKPVCSPAALCALKALVQEAGL